MSTKDEPDPKKVTNNILHSKSLLIVNTGSINNKELLQRIKKMNLKKFVLLNSTLPSWASDYPDEWIIADTNNHSASVQAVIEYNRKNHIACDRTVSKKDPTGIVSFTCITIHLNLISNSLL